MSGSLRYDHELADTRERARRRRKREKPAVAVDRTSARWRRLRAAMCEHHGLPISLDDYTDRIVSLIENMAGPDRSAPEELGGLAQKGAS